jgi:hypothetical protein
VITSSLESTLFISRLLLALLCCSEACSSHLYASIVFFFSFYAPSCSFFLAFCFVCLSCFITKLLFFSFLQSRVSFFFFCSALYCCCFVRACFVLAAERFPPPPAPFSPLSPFPIHHIKGKTPKKKKRRVQHSTKPSWCSLSRCKIFSLFVFLGYTIRFAPLFLFSGC